MRKTVTVMFRQKWNQDRCALYIFFSINRQLNRVLEIKKTLYLINKVVSTFKGRPLLHLKQSLFSDNVLPDLARYDEMHKIQVYVVHVM